jgi:PAS domain S-box-containing protein
LSRRAALLELVPNGIFVRDGDSRITYWNEGAAEFYGWSREEALGQVSHALLQTDFPEPLEDIVRTVQRSGYWEGELVQTCRDGRRVTVDSRWTLERRRPGDPPHFLEVNTDITARKLAEAALRESTEQLQSYIDQAGDAIYVLDADSGRILRANVHATEMLGYSRDELLQLSATDIERSHGPAVIRDIHDGAEQSVVEVEGVHRRKDGSTLPVEIRLTSLAPAPPRRILSIVRDASERKRLEHDRAEEARRKDEFLAVMSHELRNPLAAIDMATQVLSAGPAPAQRQLMEEIIVRQVKVMRRLVDDLLELERITHGHIGLKLERLDLAECLKRAVAAARSIVEGRRQELLLRLPSAAVPFMADGIRLDQIVGNLVSNASKYTPRGGRIELSGSAEGSEVVIRCKDNGQGISLEYQQKIFEPFSREPDTGLGYGEASVGLGLALVKQLTELHGGTVSVESAGRGLGSEFTVRLPQVRGSTVQAIGDDRSDRMPSREEPRGLRVLLVEDHPDLVALTAALLSAAGLDVRTAQSGAEALEAAPVFQPQLVLCDLHLPDIDGLQVIRQLRSTASTADSYIAILTATAEMQFTPSELDDLSVDAFISKPLTREALGRLLEALGRRGERTHL